MENVMSELIYKADKELLAKKGLEFPFNMLKNVNLGKYGKCDLVHFYRTKKSVEIDVISCNRDKISMSSFIDLVTCAKGVSKYISDNHDIDFKINLHIIAKEIDSKSNICFLPDIMPYSVNFYLYRANINGIYFESLGDFELPNEELIKPKKKKTVPKLKSLQALRETIKIAY